MRADAHEQRARQLEHAISILGDPAADPDLVPTLIENYWGAAFHWIASGCQRKYGKHKENHTQLGRYLRDLGEPTIATQWDSLEHTRQNAMYAYMEPELIGTNPAHASIAIRPIPWLDPVTSAAVADIAQSLIQAHPEVQAIILFGSVARHDERLLSDPNPSDVDLLLVINAGSIKPGAERLTHQQELALYATIGEADYRHRSPREINVLFLDHHLKGWDSLFIENVARDGIVLWTRGSLPDALQPGAKRSS